MRRTLAFGFATGAAATLLLAACSDSSPDDLNADVQPQPGQDAGADKGQSGQDAQAQPGAGSQPDAALQTEAPTVNDPLCPDGLACTDTGAGSLACMENGSVPAGAQMGCEAGDCPGNQRCRYTDETQTQTACYDNCGACGGATSCSDVTGDGYWGCLEAGAIPSNAVTGCHLTDGCDGNATCFFINAERTESVCIDNCSPCRPGGCDLGEVCDNGMCMPAPCTQDSCDPGEVCYDGTCIPDFGSGPGPDTVGDCPNLPPLFCDTQKENCAELMKFEPTVGDGYNDYPENGESASNQYRSWLRRDAVYLIKHAAAYVACKSKNWSFGNGGNVGLIDMSERDGAIPGTSTGQPGHPQGTHTAGHDIDVAYYQVNTPDNRARPICEHRAGGAEAYHCTAAPHLLDPWRTALFIGIMSSHPNLRVIGCDGKAGPILDMAMDTLCSEGWLPANACNVNKLAYEKTDQGYGWFYFHHHHIHVSFSGMRSAKSLSSNPGLENIIPGGKPFDVSDFYRKQGMQLFSVPPPMSLR